SRRLDERTGRAGGGAFEFRTAGAKVPDGFRQRGHLQSQTAGAFAQDTPGTAQRAARRLSSAAEGVGCFAARTAQAIGRLCKSRSYRITSFAQSATQRCG